MAEILYRSLDMVMEKSAGRRSVRALVGTEDVDAHNTLIYPGGIDLSVFRANPTVLVDHGLDGRFGRIPVGKAEHIELVPDPRNPRRTALEAVIKFREDAESDRVWQAYLDGSMRGFSVNLTADESRPPTKAEIRARPELARCDLVYTRGTLRELSATSVPSNPGALVTEIMRSMGGRLPISADERAYLERRRAIEYARLGRR